MNDYIESMRERKREREGEIERKTAGALTRARTASRVNGTGGLRNPLSILSHSIASALHTAIDLRFSVPQIPRDPAAYKHRFCISSG